MNSRLVLETPIETKAILPSGSGLPLSSRGVISAARIMPNAWCVAGISLEPSG